MVDVFGSVPFGGSQVTVVLDGKGLANEEMLRIARFMSGSVTTFLLSPKLDSSDYRVRFFTPASELSLAGHPSLGACHAWLSTGGVQRHPNQIVQECRAGLVRLRRTSDGLAFAAPPIKRNEPVDEELLGHIASLLKISMSDIRDARRVNNGREWVIALLHDSDAVLRLRPSNNIDINLGVAGSFRAGSPDAFEVRTFVPQSGMTAEKPVSGLLNAALACWLIHAEHLHASFTVSQGTAIGRAGRIYISKDPDGVIWVAGNTSTRMSGEIRQLPR